MAKQAYDSKQRAGNAQKGQSSSNKSVGRNASNRQQAQAQNRQATSRAAQKAVRQQQKQQDLLDAKRSRRITFFSIFGTLIIGVALVVGLILHNQTTPQTVTPVNPAYPPVNGISCDANEQLDYHIHAHVSIYINGKLSQVPQNVGIASDGSCFYWLHTHDTTGVIHIESPTQKNYTLGNFFDEWS
ncbi:MAG TPA: hypothetical protein VFQ36_02375, partial [Ktedonobacteraceae bacterium]|nr:hypothetical protein [Ktedonobacteraceae bacterium]